MMRFAYRLLPLALLAALVLAPAAHASPAQVISDCADDGVLNRGSYSNSDLRGALSNLPTDLDEYSDCREVIGAAITGGHGGHGASASSGHARPRAAAAPAHLATKRYHRLLGRLRGKPSVNVGGHTIEPGSGGLFHLSSAADDLPLPLLLCLIALALLAAGGAAWTLRRRIPAFPSVPSLRLPGVRLPRFRR